VDLKGKTAVRLQYYRWLGVEDGFYDKARILVNGTEIWKNFTSLQEPQAAGINHVDKEWRFADFDLSAQAASGSVKLRFETTSDQGLELSGWTLDDVCIVAQTGAALTCGNGTVDAMETCDDGNRVDGDGCDANCIDENPSTGEPGGCCSAGSRPEAAAALSLLVFGFVIRRRRRR
jgi:MYXO-CTERM domain-containing protein